MKQSLQVLAMMFVALFASQALAWNPPPSPKPASNISDQAHVLSPSQLQQLNTQLNQINRNSANEIGVLIVPSLDGENIRDVGIATAKAWGVGKRDLDNGVMIVWSPGDRKIGIETGKGVEGDLPDLKCNDIIRNVMGPNFRQRRYVEGLGGAFTAISQSIADHRAELAARNERQSQPNGNPQANSQGSSSPSSGGCSIGTTSQASMGSFMFLVVVVIALVWAVRRHDKVKKEREAQTQLRKMRDAVQTARQAAKPPVHHPVHPPVPITPVSTARPVDYEKERLARRRHEEEMERQEAEARQQRLLRENDDAVRTAAVAAAVVESVVSPSYSSSNDDSSSSNSSSSDSGSSDYNPPDFSPPDFGGGDFSGGGSSGDY